ncbi:MAG: polysaccharide deacetylase family protein [Clostridiaceae bacterium]|jgi:peptidoglycan/xylan/chitin deacetylase (PgdA/CDA1 family)|nr:polysaccharide deacetylase family protein [Clostridia bacterium]NMA36140.1 polysaccharide deacetylase family protein [Clostridiaceae bacterium]
MKKSRMRHILSLFLMAVVGVAFIITGTQISSLNQYPHETINSIPTLTTMPSQETSSATTSLTTLTTTTDTQTTTKDSQETSPSTAPTTTETTPSSKKTTVAKPKTTTKPYTKPPKTTPKLQGAVAITFDDGPGPHTARLLDALKEYDAKATFFVLGGYLVDSAKKDNSANRALIQRMVDEGHEVGNHSYNHPEFIKLSNDQVLSQLRRTSDAISAITGEKPTLFRPPGGSFTRRITNLAEQEGLALVLWSLDSNDWRQNNRNVDYVYRYIINNVKAGSTLLLHDIHKTTVDGFIKALPVLIERGLKLVTVSELFDLKPGNVHPSYWWK